jgi:hypothetical protein
VLLDASPLLDTGVSTDAASPDASSFTPPASPTSFSLSVGSTRCIGPCPAFSVALDQTGAVTFMGDVCTARPGYFTKQIDPVKARELYDGFVRADFWSVRDSYLSSTDGCEQYVADAVVTYFRADVAGVEKRSLRGDACTGPSALARLDGLRALLLERTDTLAWINPAQPGCGPTDASPLLLERTYRLARGADTLGILKLTANRPGSWELVDCAGSRLVSGGVAQESQRWVLLSDLATVTPPRGQHALSLPQGVGDLGSIEIRADGDAGVRATGLRSNPADDVVLTLTPASGC